MSFLTNPVVETWAQRLGWVLIHFLWEGAVIAVALAVLLRIATKASSSTRYILAGAALLLCAIAPAITWLALAPPDEASFSRTEPGVIKVPEARDNPSSAPLVSPANLPAPVASGKPWPARLIQAANTSLPYAVGLWFLGVVILSTRLTLGWMWTKRLCRSSVPVKDPPCLEKFNSLLHRMQIARSVRLLESALVEVPTLIGWLRPVILIPVSLFAGMTPDQLEAIFAHELAHVRRHDYLVNLFQTVIETILFYHPAIWWISHKLREERENCCDDIALEVMVDRLTYVSALAQLEEARATPLALAATGGSLLLRIRRIVGAQDRKASAWPLWVLIIGVLSVAFLTKSKAAGVAAPDGVVKSQPPAPLAVKLGPQEILLQAVAHDNPAEAAKAIADGAQLNLETEYPRKGTIDLDTPLYFAAEKGELDLVKLLVEHGASVQPGKSTWTNPLDAAVRNGFPAVAAYLHDHGATSDPLVYAAGLGDLDALTKLTAAGPPKNLDEAARAAAGCGQTAALTLLLGKGASAPKAFQRAAATGSVDSMRFLLGHGVDLQAVGYEALCHAAYASQTDATAFLLKAGVNPNRQKQPGDTRFIEINPPLNQAADVGATQIVSLLLQAGADPNSVIVTEPGMGNAGTTPLCNACESDSPEIVQLLLDHGAGLETVTSGGFTPALFAAYVHAPRCLALLLDRGANAKAWNPKWKCGLLDFAVIFNGEDAKREGMEVPTMDRLNQCMATVQVLLDHGMDVNSTGRMGFSLLAAAIGNGQSAWTELLLQRGARVNTVDEFGGTPLIRAIMSMGMVNEKRYYVVLDELLARGADPNLGIDNPIAGKDTTPSALKAAIGGFGTPDMLRKTVATLLAHGARFSVAKDSDTEKMLLAATRGDADGVAHLLKNGTSPNVADSRGWTPLLSATALGYDAILKLLVDAGADVNAHDATGVNAEWFALQRYPDLTDFHLLLDKGADLNADANFVFYDPPLYTAIEQHDPALLSDLLKHGASPNMLPGEHPNRFEPLELAVDQLMEKFADQKRRDIVTLLIKAGANRNPKQEGYRSSLLYFPVANNMIDMVKFLLNAGIDPRKDVDGGQGLSDQLEYHGSKEMKSLVHAALNKT